MGDTRDRWSKAEVIIGAIGAAGSIAIPIMLFVVASFIGRGGRFFLVAGLLIWGGQAMERRLKQHIDTLGWITVAGIAVALVIYGWQ